MDNNIVSKIASCLDSADENNPIVVLARYTGNEIKDVEYKKRLLASAFS